MLNLMKFIPKNVKYPILRSMLALPMSLPKELHFEIATTEAQYLGAFRILQECYLEKGYASSNQSKIRMTPYHLIPTTTVLLAYWKNEIVGTVSLIRDNSLGLPMEKIFDLSDLRKKDGVLCEISSLAIKKEFRGQDGQLFFPFMRYMWNLSYHFLDIDYFVIAVNPSMYELYESIYLFETLKRKSVVSKYDFANNNPAVGQYIHLKSSFDKFDSVYRNNNIKSNFGYYMKNSMIFHEKFPLQEFFTQVYSPVRREWIPKLKHLLSEPYTKELSNKLARCFGYPSEEGMIMNPEYHRYRYPVSFQILNYEGSKVVNISKTGIALKSTLPIPPEIPIFLTCKIGPEKKTTIVVEKVREDRQSGIIGMKIIKESESWNHLISSLQNEGDKHYDFDSESSLGFKSTG